MAQTSVRPPRARVWLIKCALTVNLLALIATSSLPEWSVDDTDSKEAAFFVAGGPTAQQAQGTILYRTPRGRWPLSMTSGATTHEGRNPYQVTASFETDERLKPRKTNTGSAEYDVQCEEDMCEGSVSVLLTLERLDANLPAEGAQMMLRDGGLVLLAPPNVTLRAGFMGGLDAPVVGCDGKDSSTDSEDAPEGLGVEVTLDSFDAASDAGVLPGKGGLRDASTALVPMQGLDAGR